MSSDTNGRPKSNRSSLKIFKPVIKKALGMNNSSISMINSQ